jgi:hypothetical protein
MTPEQIKEKYAARIEKILSNIREALVEDGWHVEEPWEMGGNDEYRWTMLVSATNPHIDGTEPDEDDVDISLTILESEHNDGEENGVNFGVDVVTVGGSILGGMTPYNYTNRVWVARDQPEAIEERFTLVEDCDPAGIVHMLEDRKPKPEEN